MKPVERNRALAKTLTEKQWGKLKVWACTLADPTCLADYITSLEESESASAARRILRDKDWQAILQELIAWARSQDMPKLRNHWIW